MSLCFSRLTISSMISPSPLTSLEDSRRRFLQTGMWSSSVSCFGMRSVHSASPGPPCFGVHHPADHALPGLVLLFSERPLGGEPGLLLICHDCRGKQNLMHLHHAQVKYGFHVSSYDDGLLLTHQCQICFIAVVYISFTEVFLE